MLYTRNSNYNKAGKCFSKADSTLKRLSSPIIELLIDSNKIYLHSLIGECTIEQCDLFKNMGEILLFLRYNSKCKLILV